MNKQEMKLISRILENLPDMSSEVMQGWIENPSALKKLLSGLVPEETSFTTITKTIVGGGTYNLKDFYKNCEGLWLSMTFDDINPITLPKRILVDEVTVGFADLKLKFSETEILNSFPKRFVFDDRDAFLAYLASLIGNQRSGEEGPLNNTPGQANIFYLMMGGETPHIISVSWSADDLEWTIVNSKPSAGCWAAGTRVFSAIAP